MTERKREIKLDGEYVTIVGEKIKVGDKAPDFSALRNDESEFKLSELSGKVKIISMVPSVNTPVCELQTIRFNKEAADLNDITVLTISTDKPAVLSKFCGNHGIENTLTLSDSKDFDFGHKYGFRVKDHDILTRGIVVIDKEDTVRYVEYVREITNHPDYEDAIEAAKKLV